MKKTLPSLLKYYYDQLKLFKAFSVAQSLLSWDRETHMPKGASVDRGEAMSVLAGFSHQLFTDQEFVRTVEFLYDHQDELTPIEKRSVQLTKKDLDKSVQLTKEFVEETNVVVNSAYSAWLEAKQTNNYSLFQPHLKAVIENRKQYAEMLATGKDAYDVLLDEYEEGLTAAQLQPLFKELRAGLVTLLPKVLKKQKKVANPLDGHTFDKHKLEEFLRSMVGTIGFDLNRGAFGSVEHPFEINISHNDVRLNTNFSPEGSSFTIMGMVHELGHGLYEQNCSDEYSMAGLDHGVSLGIHESQSRFLENMVGRSAAFWQFFLPRLQGVFPELLKDVTVDSIHQALNVVEPSLIRTEADEVTYNLHIILRFEVEQELMKGTVDVKDIPEVWRAKMKEFFGIEPGSDKEGVLQDVHWAWGNIGYFPTYTLGNINAAQLLRSFSKAHPHWQAEVAEGNFTSYFSWSKEHIWKHGSFLPPIEVMTTATGEAPKAAYLLEYLTAKYLKQ
jgi:carboxypeptidase Taq